MKTTSRFAIAAAAGVIAGGLALSPAQAADFGGDCCADLEERIAELEATTVRKGTRVVSLTINGWVHKGVMFWDDGHESNAYVVDSTRASSRIRFSGNARIDPDWSAGFVYEFEYNSAASSSASQFSNGSGTTRYNTRHAYWWLRSDRLGQISVGQQSLAADGVGAVDLGATVASAARAPHHHSQNFEIFSPTLFNPATGQEGNYTGVTWRSTWHSFGNAHAHGARGNYVRYDSPSLAGFIASASWGADDTWSAALRYAQEWNSIRVAAAVGYLETSDADQGCTNYSALTSGGTVGILPSTAASCNALVGSASIMHTPSGLFISGGAGETEDEMLRQWAGVFRPLFPTAQIDDTDNHWWLQGGIKRQFLTQPWFGATTFYVGYYEAESGTRFIGGPGAGGRGNALVAGVAPGGTFNPTMQSWDVGVQQEISAAAMEIYAFYRNYSLDSLTLHEADGVARSDVSASDFSDLDVFMVGGRIRF